MTKSLRKLGPLEFFVCLKTWFWDFHEKTTFVSFQDFFPQQFADIVQKCSL